MEDLILCLQWLLFAKRPLKPEELYYGILVGVDLDSVTPLDSEQIDPQDLQNFVLNSSRGLAEVTKAKAKTVQFIHESVRDYLLKSKGLERLQASLTGNLTGLSHERLKKCCESYMRISVSQDPLLEAPWRPPIQMKPHLSVNGHLRFSISFVRRSFLTLPRRLSRALWYSTGHLRPGLLSRKLDYAE